MGREWDGSVLEVLGKVQEKRHDERLTTAFLTPDELCEPELASVESFSKS